MGRKKFVPETLHLKCLTRAAQGEAEEAGGAEEASVSTPDPQSTLAMNSG